MIFFLVMAYLQVKRPVGLSFQLGAFTIDIACEIPTVWYRGESNDFSTVEGVLALSFSI